MATTVNRLIDSSRQVLTADQTYYVSTSGSDSNSGTSPDTAFHSIQKAIDTAYSLDCNGHKIVINVADGTYTGPVHIEGSLVGARNSLFQPLQIIGNEAAPANVIISPSSDTAFSVQNWAYVLLAGMTIEATTGGYGLNVKHHSTIEHRNLIFGDVFVDMIIAQYHSSVIALGPTTVNGNANAFVHCTTHSRVSFSDQTISFTKVGGSTFGTYLWGLNDATVAIDGATLSGTQPTGGTLIHDHSLLNAYSITNVNGWGYLGKSAPLIEDGSIITADGFRNRRFYVRADADGNENDGLENTTARAFKSIQSCIDFIAEFPFNPADFSVGDGVHITVADGTYAETIHLRYIRSYISAALEGNTTTPANVVIASPEDAVAGIALATKWTIQGMKLVPIAGKSLRVEQGTQVSFKNIDFAANTGRNQISALTGARALAIGPYTISGGGRAHIYAASSIVDISSVAVTITGTPAFSSFVNAERCGIVKAIGTTYTGSATGARYSISTCAVVDTAGAGTSALPGGSAGSTATGGQYA